jgi:crotonobetainyl-CoA:carnitine CoA-transferase CaiB-like acyl-CoA transferase
MLPALALIVLAASGLVLATSWTLDYSNAILAIAWAVTVIAGITVVVTGWRDARRTGHGYLRSVSRSMRRLGRFTIDVF